MQQNSSQPPQVEQCEKVKTFWEIAAYIKFYIKFHISEHQARSILLCVRFSTFLCRRISMHFPIFIR